MQDRDGHGRFSNPVGLAPLVSSLFLPNTPLERKNHHKAPTWSLTVFTTYRRLYLGQQPCLGTHPSEIFSYESPKGNRTVFTTYRGLYLGQQPCLGSHLSEIFSDESPKGYLPNHQKYSKEIVCGNGQHLE